MWIAAIFKSQGEFSISWANLEMTSVALDTAGIEKITGKEWNNMSHIILRIQRTSVTEQITNTPPKYYKATAKQNYGSIYGYMPVKWLISARQ